MNQEKVTISYLKQKEDTGKKITMMTAYDYPTAKLVDKVGIDTILVGDSLGMVVLGYDSTVSVTMDEMLHHLKAVSRGAKKSFIIGDMPFMSYQTSVEEAVRNAGRFMKVGCDAVKLEGGEEVTDKVAAIVKAGIPVLGHIGLTPQSIHRIGGYRVQGRDEEQAEKLMRDAKLLEEAGCFSIVLEAVPMELAKKITESLTIPTIGIGAGPYCDGQVLVHYDLLGFYDKVPRFVRKYKYLKKDIISGIKEFVNDIKELKFPSEKEIYI